jgi:hypothetical protein
VRHEGDRHWAPVYLKAIVTVRQGDAWVDAGAYAASVGLSDDDARVVGAAFDQVAVFRVTASELAVLACREDWAVRRALP